MMNLSVSKSSDAKDLACIQAAAGGVTKEELTDSGLAGGEEDNVSLCWFCMPKKNCAHKHEKVFVGPSDLN
jgi:hypothetical protein